MNPTHTTALVDSGDVKLFVRKFGIEKEAPILILHGANYYDSADWIDVGLRLAFDRQVAAFDARGFGQSSWSASKDYSFASALADIRAVLDHLRWPRAVIVGHSRGGSHALLAAARAPEIAERLVLVDYNPARGFGPPRETPSPISGSLPIFPTVEAALETMTRYKTDPLTFEARARALQFLQPVDGGYQLSKRDPLFANRDGRTAPALVPESGFDELSRTKCPVLVIRAKKASIFNAEDLMRLAATGRIEIREIDSGHDVAGEAPASLVTELSKWLNTGAK